MPKRSEKMNDDTLINLFHKFSDFLSINSFAKDVARDAVMWLIKGLVSINGVMEHVFYLMIKLLAWPTTETMRVLVNDPKKGLVILAVTLMGITLLFIGAKLILGDQVAFQQFVRNFILVTIVFIGLTGIMGSVNKLTLAGVDVGKNAFSTEKDSLISYQLVKDNITDLKALDEAKWKTTTPKKQNYLTEDSWKSANYNEIVEKDFSHAKGLSKSKLSVNDKGKEVIEDLDKSFWLPSSSENYYRYHVNFTAILVQEIFIFLVFAFSSITIVQVAFELGVIQTIGGFIAASDLATGQRMKNLFMDIINSNVKVVLLVVMIQLYRMFMHWTQGIQVTDSLAENLIFKTLVTVGAFFAVLRGSNSVQRLLGVDVSQGFGQQALMGTYAATQMAKGAGSFTGNFLKGGAKQFGKNGIPANIINKQKERKQEKARKEGLSESLGGKSNYKDLMNPKRNAEREGFMQGQQIMETEKQMQQHQSNQPGAKDNPSNKDTSPKEETKGKHPDSGNKQPETGKQDAAETNKEDGLTTGSNGKSPNRSTNQHGTTTSSTGSEPVKSKAVDRLNAQKKQKQASKPVGGNPRQNMSKHSTTSKTISSAPAPMTQEQEEEKEEGRTLYTTKASRPPQRKAPRKPVKSKATQTPLPKKRKPSHPGKKGK